jgi:hypothetical protein
LTTEKPELALLLHIKCGGKLERNTLCPDDNMLSTLPYVEIKSDECTCEIDFHVAISNSELSVVLFVAIVKETEILIHTIYTSGNYMGFMKPNLRMLKIAAHSSQ